MPSLRPLPALSQPRPSFASLLSSSLRTQADLKAWFDERHGYQVPLQPPSPSVAPHGQSEQILPRPPFQSVRQTRVPTRLPQVIVVSCGMQDRGDIAWWMPISDGKGGERPW